MFSTTDQALFSDQQAQCMEFLRRDLVSWHLGGLRAVVWYWKVLCCVVGCSRDLVSCWVVGERERDSGDEDAHYIAREPVYQTPSPLCSDTTVVSNNHNHGVGDFYDAFSQTWTWVHGRSRYSQ